MKNNMDRRVRVEDRFRNHKQNERCSALKSNSNLRNRLRVLRDPFARSMQCYLKASKHRLHRIQDLCIKRTGRCSRIALCIQENFQYHRVVLGARNMGARCTEDVRSHHERKVFAPAAAKRSSFTQANFCSAEKYAVCNSEPAAQTAHDQTQAWAVPVHA